MQRLTISLDDEIAGQLDDYIRRHGYTNRSEAFRDLLRARIEAERAETSAGRHCVASLTYIYNHEERELAARLVRTQHAHHDVRMSTLHVHLDHHDCMELVAMEGATGRVRELADAIVSQPGVRHGRLHVVPVEPGSASHHHGPGQKTRGRHLHLRPKT
jgi:CopG family transcriptional regulator, nickel-responsive regulator